MIVNCPHCGKQLKLGEKVQESVRRLSPGRTVKLKCVHCSEPFGLDEKSLDSVAARPAVSHGDPADPSPAGKVRPPGPPDLAWLKEGTFEDREIVEDIPRALVLMPHSASCETVVRATTEFGYLVERASSAEEAVEMMRFVNYAAVFLSDGFEPGDFESGAFHRFMRAMNMSRRRYIFYVLIGHRFKTLYDLQALACSANLVVNEGDIPFIGTVLKKAIPEFETLFGPLMEELQVAGK